MSIYNPYFYIIRHIPSGKMYAGSRYAKKCHPDELMKENGYITSSNKIKKVISEDGLHSFEILRIDTYCDGIHPHDYETLFLEINNCANSNDWFNKHNNNIIPLRGEHHHMNDPSVVSKIHETCLEKYGSKWHMGSKNFFNKTKETLNIKYKVENISQLENIKLKKKLTMIQNYGSLVEMNVARTTKTKETCLEKYGTTNPLSSGTESFTKKNKTIEQRYNVKNIFQDTEVKKKIKETCLEKYGVDNIAKFKVTCPHCAKTGGYGGMKIWHFDNCKFKKK